MGVLELARRTGRFPQLVDPRSRVNGLLFRDSPGFRGVSLEERRSCSERPATASVHRDPSDGRVDCDGVDPFPEPRTSRAVDVEWRQPE